MSEWVGVDAIEGVGPVAVKRRRPAEDPGLLDREAEALEAIDGPGAVRVVERRDEPTAALVTRFVGTHSLATAPPPEIDEAIALAARLARTVADLHRQGIRHGRIEPSHVLLGPGGRPVLCGFSRAGLPDDADAPPTTADDVAGLGAVIRHLVGDGDDLEPIPSRRRLSGGRWDGYRTRALLTLADHCQADDPTVRPSAASLASSLADLDQPDGSIRRRTPARWRSGPDPQPRLGGLSRPGRWVAVALLTGVGLVATGAVLKALRPTPSPVAAARPPSPAGGSTTLDRSRPLTAADHRGVRGPTVSTTPTRPPARPTTRPVTVCSDPTTARAGADIDGDGCPEGRARVDGHRVVVGRTTFVVGRPGDRVVTGDWDCDGLVTAVVARDDPRGVWHFPGWPAEGRRITADLVTEAAGPGDLTRRPTGDGCHQLMAADEDGRPRALVVTP